MASASAPEMVAAQHAASSAWFGRAEQMRCHTFEHYYYSAHP